MSLPWIRFYSADYRGKTVHLTTQQHGTYFLLLTQYYATMRALPGDLPTLQRVALAFTQEGRADVDLILKEFFTLEDDGFFHNKRADEEIAEAIAHHTKVCERSAQGVAAKRAARIERETRQAELAMRDDENPSPSFPPRPPTTPNPKPAPPAPPTCGTTTSSTTSSTNPQETGKSENPKNGRQAGGGVTEDRSSIMGVDTPKPPLTSDGNINGKTKVDPERQRWLKFLKNAEGLPDVMRCAEPTAGQREKVLQQLNAIVLDDYDRKSGATQKLNGNRSKKAEQIPRRKPMAYVIQELERDDEYYTASETHTGEYRVIAKSAIKYASVRSLGSLVGNRNGLTYKSGTDGNGN